MKTDLLNSLHVLSRAGGGLGTHGVGRRREALFLAAAVATVFATRVGYLPTTLEDIDSVNFDRGVHFFYPFGDQPHPPGYAVFIAVAKLVHPLFASHAAGLASPSVVFSAIALVPLYRLFRLLLLGRPQAALACVLVMFNPVFWINSVRPMSDITGFAAVIGAQYLLVAAIFSERSREWQRLVWYLGVGLAGLAIGVRVQAAVLVGPVLALGFFTLRRLRLQSIAVFAAACALWIVPTVVASRGVSRLLARQAQVVAEAWPSEPLVSGVGWRRVYVGAVDALVAPWDSPWLAGIILLAAVAGLGLLWRDQRRSLSILLLLFGPYAVYHYLLQAAELRYTIPILPMVAAPAAAALAQVVRCRTLGVAGIAASFLVISIGLTMPALDAYAGGPSPPADAVQYLRHLAGTEAKPIVAAGDFVFNRYLSQLDSSVRIIRTKPNEEWRALNRFWVAGERGPIWFLRDPARTILQLQDQLAQTHIAEWYWPHALTRLIKGARPTRVELVRLDPPRWFAESGFFLTSEAGHPDQVAREKHLLFVRSDLTSHELVVSGTSSRTAVVMVIVGDQAQSEWNVDSGFLVRVAVPPDPGGAYVPVDLKASAPLLLTSVAVTASGEVLALPVTGFYALERDERGQEFRWMGPRAEVIVSGSGAPVRVSLRGRAPDHYSLPLTLQVAAPGWQGRTYQVTERDFVLELDVPAVDRGSTTTVTFSAGQSFVPDEVERNGDRRSLALRVYDLRANGLH